jgi:hypothetical protein
MLHLVAIHMTNATTCVECRKVRVTASLQAAFILLVFKYLIPPESDCWAYHGLNVLTKGIRRGLLPGLSGRFLTEKHKRTVTVDE